MRVPWLQVNVQTVASAKAPSERVGSEATPNPNIAICVATLGFACVQRQPARYCTRAKWASGSLRQAVPSPAKYL